MRNSSFVLTLRYCRRSKLVFTSFCFPTISKPDLTSAARIVDQNNQKGSPKRLSFLTICSVRRSFEQFYVVWISDKEAFRIIQSHHVIKHAVFKESKDFLTVCRNTASYRTVLPFGTPDSGSKFRRYQVFIRYYWSPAGMTMGSRLSKRKRNVLRRDDYFYFCQYSFQICITDQAWGGQYDWIYGKISFSFFLDLFKVLYFFPGSLCHETSLFARSLRDLTHWSSLRLLTFKNLWEVDL